MKGTLQSEKYEGLEVEYEYTTCPDTWDTPGLVEVEILTVRAVGSSVNLYDFLAGSVLDGLETEIQEKAENEDAFDEIRWEESRWAA
jgi:hypothetical protein